ncbi:ABC transporter transmembrane domain-containing protein [Corynebacterium aquatimens]|uniref:ABC transporter transmembrane domain-containing protein n=1 Tax=Corynebacterium aquatimens TaxID=1190508 RepID=UPI0025410665|nr:ABC transporter transmembrane domain-containing protein [Corynebacterium aquatimens]
MLLIARGVLIGTVAAGTVTGTLLDDASLFTALVLVVLAHGLVAWLAARAANRSVGAVVDTLRTQAMRALAARDPREVEERAGYWRHVLTRGLGDFRPFLTEFLPALVATCVGTPLALAVVFYYDWVSGLICVITLPLIPFFMVLIGKLTADHTRRRLEVTAGLGAQLGDLLAGAPTLRALHAAERPARQIRESGERHERATMSVLRLAFLSSFALEFLATLSVAVVAVSIGLRLVVGEIALLPGLVVLIIVPEVFNPVRRVGGAYHAAADGLEAADAVLTLIDAPRPSPVLTCAAGPLERPPACVRRA